MRGLKDYRCLTYDSIESNSQYDNDGDEMKYDNIVENDIEIDDNGRGNENI